MKDKELLDDVRNLKRDTRVTYYQISGVFGHTASWSSNLMNKVPPFTAAQRENLLIIREYLLGELILRSKRWQHKPKQLRSLRR